LRKAVEDEEHQIKQLLTLPFDMVTAPRNPDKVVKHDQE